MREKTIVKIWVIFIVIWVFVMFFGTSCLDIYWADKFNTMRLVWIRNSFLIGMFINILFMVFAAAYSKNKFRDKNREKF